MALDVFNSLKALPPNVLPVVRSTIDIGAILSLNKTVSAIVVHRVDHLSLCMAELTLHYDAMCEHRMVSTSRSSEGARWGGAPRLVPNTVSVVWESEALPSTAKLIDQFWRDREPNYERRVVTLAQCSIYAQEYLAVSEVVLYESLPLGMMKARVCRLFILLKTGGIVVDIDVERITPLDHWFNASIGLHMGYEQGTNVANWFLASSRNHPCIHHALAAVMLAIRNARDIESQLAVNPGIVNHVVGFNPITPALNECPEEKAIYTEADVTWLMLHHHFGSINTEFAKAGYPSWHRDCAAIRWRIKMPKGLSPANGGALHSRVTRLSHGLAVDTDLNTTVNLAVNETWSLALVPSAPIGCITTVANRFADLDSFMSLTIHAVDNGGKVHSSQVLNGNIYSSGPIVAFSLGSVYFVSAVEVARSLPGRLSVSEVQLFSDVGCTVRYTVDVDRDSTALHAGATRGS